MQPLAKVAITRKIHSAAEELLRSAQCEVWVNPEARPLQREELCAIARDYDAMICLLSDRIDEEIFSAAKRLRIVANYAVGFDNIDIPAATRRGIAVANTPDVLTNATAELAWALLLSVARRVVEGDRLVRAGEFHGWDPLMLLGYEVAGKTLGIIGAGRIGTAMARRARGFDMRILYTRPSGPRREMDELGAQHVELETLLCESDFISIHTPLTPATRHMIGRPQFELMKPTAILINTGRGPVVDEAALADALANRRIAGAGLDVYEYEPKVEPALLALDNVVLLPHIGSATFEARAAMARLAAENVLDALRGKVPRTCLNPEYQQYCGVPPRD
ncbi:D-3-phosphoglycerate dehydrogenase [Candidatus Sumerlaea chitinivorans]|uniref:D-3-phosphoglycerate dehydrogenase n=1 Tax=Sumerlaea chitinivorans TaxID=2250252 RepID=A0A2Z4Y155_SUMC1|nr:D-3-phosphoglycerate dehydrogenase [Candidatus Sumerlaea chitinivorans]